jgi:RimJ/RimL family protein N-acetyltransferase
MTTNAPSIAILERTGFAREGRLRQFRIAGNTPRDFYVYALLRRHFAK